MVTKTPKPKIKSVSFKYRNFNCYEYIKDIDNFSDYVCDLIKLDMEHGLLRNRYNLPKPQIELEVVGPKHSEAEIVKPEQNKSEVEKVTVSDVIKPEQDEVEVEPLSDEVLSNFDDFIN